MSESRLPEDQQQNCLEEEKRMTQQEVTRSKVTGQGKVMGRGLSGRGVQEQRSRNIWISNKPEARIGPGKDRISELRTHTFEQSSPVVTTGHRHLEWKSGGPALSSPGEAAKIPVIALHRQMD